MQKSDSSLRLTLPEPTEADVLASVLEYLSLTQRQGRVVWYARMNTGAGRLARRDGSSGQWMQFGFPGCPDVLGQLAGGRLMALEVKKPTGRVRPEQEAFLARARDGGALAEVVRSVDDVHRLISARPPDVAQDGPFRDHPVPADPAGR